MSKVKKGVKLEHISKIYQDPKTGKDFYAVKDTSLTIEPGSFVTLLGPSGCGKTTTLRMIAGFESPDEGEIYLGDEAINALTPNKRDTAMVFQSYALLPHYNVFDNVAYGLKLRKVAKNEIQERVMRILDLVELTGMEGTTTRFSIRDDTVVLARTGMVNSQLVFQRGKRNSSLYETPWGMMQVDVFTTSLAHRLDGRGGILEIKFNISVDHQVAGENQFKIRVRESGR